MSDYRLYKRYFQGSQDEYYDDRNRYRHTSSRSRLSQSRSRGPRHRRRSIMSSDFPRRPESRDDFRETEPRSSSNAPFDLLMNSLPISPDSDEANELKKETQAFPNGHPSNLERSDASNETSMKKPMSTLTSDDINWLVEKRTEVGTAAIHIFEKAVDKVMNRFQDNQRIIEDENHELLMLNEHLKNKVKNLQQNKVEDVSSLKAEITALKTSLQSERDEKEKLKNELHDAREDIKILEDKLDKRPPESHWRKEISKMENAYIKEKQEMKSKYEAEIQTLETQLASYINK